ncbi:conserved hypothetical protein [Microsporum canis CBS 113480]|uniref:Uncharacterized protein n=1 Tax=Arthroderma otae (strain ATCC MYA-4605 / CBS 113480) TaxID=554155 RepID=C5FCE9_ARTOC|nr:conserved hypothetical protein [Microsporum canis CBS 113480]EEQ27393.1 conserved hypothetical protein [Microsporum canis CBS 113480]
MNKRGLVAISFTGRNDLHRGFLEVKRYYSSWLTATKIEGYKGIMHYQDRILPITSTRPSTNTLIPPNPKNKNGPTYNSRAGETEDTGETGTGANDGAGGGTGEGWEGSGDDAGTGTGGSARLGGTWAVEFGERDIPGGALGDGLGGHGAGDGAGRGEGERGRPGDGVGLRAVDEGGGLWAEGDEAGDDFGGDLRHHTGADERGRGDAGHGSSGSDGERLGRCLFVAGEEEEEEEDERREDIKKVVKGEKRSACDGGVAVEQDVSYGIYMTVPGTVTYEPNWSRDRRGRRATGRRQGRNREDVMDIMDVDAMALLSVLIPCKGY